MPNSPSYDDTKSSTVEKSDQGAHITFGSGSLSGHFFTDTMTIGEGAHKIQIENQRFGNVEKQKHIFKGSFEAIIGMAYPSFAEKGVTPVFDSMINQHLL